LAIRKAICNEECVCQSGYESVWYCVLQYVTQSVKSLHESVWHCVILYVMEYVTQSVGQSGYDSVLHYVFQSVVKTW
jgi:hypothetical protein